MYFSTLLASAAALATVQAQYAGFNYGSTFTDGSAKQQSDFQAEFSRAKTLQGTNGEFTSARLYTMIQGGTTNTPISAIPAAIDTKTTLLLGLWASAGQADISNEITALKSAINQYGTAFTSLIAGISVGSEDLYRISPTGIENKSGAGANPSDLVSYISQVRAAIAGTSASSATIGHVDTWTAWVNGSNAAVVSACDWLGMDAYPYFQTTIDNSINVANSTFFEAYDNTVAVSQGKPVWITETGWPVSGPTENQAIASTANAELYWQDVACTVLGKINTWWYILQDAQPTTPSPSFGIVGSDLSSAPLYNLTCNNSKTVASSSSSSTASSTATSITSSAASPTAPASASGANSESLSAATPGPESSPASVTISQTSAHSVTAVASGTASAASTSKSSAPVTSTSAAVSSAPVASSSVAVSSAPKVSTSAVVSGSTTVSGGKTYTTYQTTLITITSCPSGCSSTVKATSVSPSASVHTSASSSAPISSPISAQSSIKASSTASAASTPSSCPANLNGEYQYPHLIVPVDSSNPTKAAGTQYFGTVTPTISTIFNFDLPYSYANKTCSLLFLFPQKASLETSDFTFNGVGGIVVNELSEPATESTSWNTVPAPAVAGLGSIANVQPGNNYVIASHRCAAGSRIGFEFQSTGGLNLTWFNDWNPSPIGAFISVC